MQLAILLCLGIILLSILVYFISCAPSYRKNIILESRCENINEASILWVSTLDGNSSKVDLKKNIFYQSFDKKTQHHFAVLTRNLPQSNTSQLPWKAQPTNIVYTNNGDENNVARAGIREEDEEMLSWLILLPQVLPLVKQLDCSHIALINPTSPIYDNLHEIQCSASVDMFCVQSLSKRIAALGFHRECVDYLIPVLTDMVHIPDLDTRFKTLKMLFVHCEAFPFATEIENTN